MVTMTSSFLGTTILPTKLSKDENFASFPCFSSSFTRNSSNINVSLSLNPISRRCGKVYAVHTETSLGQREDCAPTFVAAKDVFLHRENSTTIVTESTTVRPAAETPKETLWLSNIDLMMPRCHIPTVYFFRSDGSANFFDTRIMKEALSKALDIFHPMAGRLKIDDQGRAAIDCNGEGVVFVEAESDSVIDDFGDFAPTMQLSQLIPKVHYADDISTIPLFLVQVTRFKCGGVCLAPGIMHQLADGSSTTDFFHTWSRIARGLNPHIQPFTDRSLLRSRDPPVPSFPHIEYQLSPSMKIETHPHDATLSVAVFQITHEQLNLLNAKTTNDSVRYTQFESLAAHIWRCASEARLLSEDQQTKLCMSIDGRYRLRPRLPASYLGNATFTAASVTKSGDLLSGNLTFGADKVRQALMQMDNEYLRSAVDYLELQEDLDAVAQGANRSECPNLWITSVSSSKMGIYDTNYGWGRPIFVGPAVTNEGLACILSSATNDKSLSLVISLWSNHMSRFQKIFYEF